MAEKVLAPWLEKEYKMVKGKVVPKKPLSYTINGETKQIPDGAVWINAFTKNGTNTIVSCVPLLTHAHCLTLAREYEDVVKFKGAKREAVQWAHSDPNLHGYYFIINEDGIYGDGETHRDTLQKSMHAFANTMLVKRAEDRLILRALGLYEQGFYSEVEFVDKPVESVEIDKIAENKTNTITPDESAAIKRKNMMGDIGDAMKVLKDNDPQFDGRVFITNLTNKEPADSRLSNFSLPEVKVIWEALHKKLGD